MENMQDAREQFEKLREDGAERYDSARERGIYRTGFHAGYDAGTAAENEACAKELRALRDYKKRIDSTWTAGMLLLTHQVEGPQDYFPNNFIDDLKATMREAEREYMNNFGAEAIRARRKGVEP